MHAVPLHITEAYTTTMHTFQCTNKSPTNNNIQHTKNKGANRLRVAAINSKQPHNTDFIETKKAKRDIASPSF